MTKSYMSRKIYEIRSVKELIFTHPGPISHYNSLKRKKFKILPLYLIDEKQLEGERTGNKLRRYSIRRITLSYYKQKFTMLDVQKQFCRYPLKKFDQLIQLQVLVLLQTPKLSLYLFHPMKCYISIGWVFFHYQ